MMWVVYGHRCTLGYVKAETMYDALTKARTKWGSLAVVYAQEWHGVL